ncbi:MAG: hypothetical protein NZU63_10855 [Gemmataceae bacterium]|nr:hypothetical protein [Gemmataceae bacterium]MDW8244674.1 hypothetical protein [Thermogemmata sp.]
MKILSFLLFGVVICLGRLIRWWWWSFRSWASQVWLNWASRSLGRRLQKQRWGDQVLLTQIDQAPDSQQRGYYLQLLGLSVLMNRYPPLLVETEYSKRRPRYVNWQENTRNWQRARQNIWPTSLAEQAVLVLHIGLLIGLSIWLLNRYVWSPATVT